jgi:hypothetical protein
MNHYGAARARSGAREAPQIALILADCISLRDAPADRHGIRRYHRRATAHGRKLLVLPAGFPRSLRYCRGVRRRVLPGPALPRSDRGGRNRAGTECLSTRPVPKSCSSSQWANERGPGDPRGRVGECWTDYTRIVEWRSLAPIVPMGAIKSGRVFFPAKNCAQRRTKMWPRRRTDVRDRQKRAHGLAGPCARRLSTESAPPASASGSARLTLRYWWMPRWCRMKA